MNLIRFAPFAATILAGAAIVAGVACGGGDDDDPATPPPATETASATATPTEAPPTPTPTPTPYAGLVTRLAIPRFGVDAPIEELGVDSTNTLETPTNENTDVGWYSIYDRPGWHGNAVFSAHVYYHNIPAPFVNLAKSVEGDQIVVTMADGTQYTYQVISNTRYNRDTIPMGDIIWPKNKPEGKEWITLITCGGQLDSTGWEYLDRDVIVAERVS
ncbi:MAG: class F sortase [Hyphomicrobiales bacterium]